MKKIISLLAVVLFVFAGGCKKDTPPACPTTKPATTQPAPLPGKKEFTLLKEKLLSCLRFDKFADRFISAYNLAMSEPMTYIRAGDRALAEDNAEAAVRFFTTAVRWDKKNADALRGMAAGYVAMGDHNKAADTCVDILKHYPHDEEARFNLAMALVRTAKPSLAVIEFEKLLSSPAYGCKARFNLAAALQSQGRLDEAQIRLTEFLENPSPKSPAVIAQGYSQLGEVYIDMDDYTRAMEAYGQVTRIEPYNCLSWINLAEAARAAGNYGYAVTAAKKAAGLAPHNADIQRRLGNIFLELHRYTNNASFLDRALDAWKKSAALAPDQTDLQKQIEIYSK